jgi:hypothetical protein
MICANWTRAAFGPIGFVALRLPAESRRADQRPPSAGGAEWAARADGRPARNPVGRAQPTLGWIPQGRDTVLEQMILEHIHARLGGFGPPRPF